jgi:SNF2 family DNA or RNA helicase
LSLQQRDEALIWFRNKNLNGDGKILLISLRAGGVGLNLTVATRCYLLDPWWNPAVESQAIQRIHRLGQMYPVKIYRLIVEVY